jgi:hypothetical protein
MVCFARRAAVFVFLFAVMTVTPAGAYSLLTHEQLIDLTWQDSIAPLLLRRYPKLTPQQLQTARAYAYGGCVIQDIGYYPFGDPFFSELTHYVRSGDFVVNLFREARNANELAFAIGALSHYIGDSIGHAEATNRAVPVEFPKLAAEFGPVVTYADNEHAHVQTEFAFDIDEIAHRRFAPLRYLRRIGLGVPTAQLATAFYQTYGIGEDFTRRRSRRVNVRGYRFAVHGFLPRIAYALTVLNRNNMPPDSQSPDALKLQAEAARVARENDWDKYRTRPGLITYSLAGLICILPKVGALKPLAIKGPSPATEEEYVRSVNRSTDALRAAIAQLRTPRQNPEERYLENRDLDTGAITTPGSYPLTDQAYAILLHKLVVDPRVPVPARVKSNVLDFYADPDAPNSTKMNNERWSRVQAELTVLQSMPVNDQPLFNGVEQGEQDAGAPKRSPDSR